MRHVVLHWFADKGRQLWVIFEYPKILSIRKITIGIRPLARIVDSLAIRIDNSQRVELAQSQELVFEKNMKIFVAQLLNILLGQTEFRMLSTTLSSTKSTAWNPRLTDSDKVRLCRSKLVCAI